MSESAQRTESHATRRWISSTAQSKLGTFGWATTCQCQPGERAKRGSWLLCKPVSSLSLAKPPTVMVTKQYKRKEKQSELCACADVGNVEHQKVGSDTVISEPSETCARADGRLTPAAELKSSSCMPQSHIAHRTASEMRRDEICIFPSPPPFKATTGRWESSHEEHTGYESSTVSSSRAQADLGTRSSDTLIRVRLGFI